MFDEILLIFSLLIFCISIYLFLTKGVKKFYESNFFYIMLISGGLFLILFFNYFVFDKFFLDFHQKSFYYKFYLYSFSKFKFFYENLKFYSNKTWNNLNLKNNNFLNNIPNFFYEALIFSAKLIIGIINFAIDSFVKGNQYLNGKNFNETENNFKLNETNNDI